LFGSHNSQIATLAERHTRYVMLVRVKSKYTETVINALIKQAHKLPRELYKSLTWDRGKEMADHKRFSLATDIKVYFCDPQSPWQRGSNEQINGLLRQCATYRLSATASCRFAGRVQTYSAMASISPALKYCKPSSMTSAINPSA